MAGFDFRKAPSTRDGRPIVLSSVIGDDQDVQFAGSGDDVTNGTRFEGTKFKQAIASQGATNIEWQFIEWIELTGGGVHVHSAVMGDYMHYEIYAPATSCVEESGDFDKYSLGGPYNMFTPANPGEGSWSLDLTSTLNANVDFTAAVPIFANGTGYFDYNLDTDTLTVNYSGTGGYNLFDFSMTLTRIVSYFHVIGDCQDSFVVPASYGGKLLLPHFKHKLTFNTSESSPSVDVLWWLFLGRACTQP